MTTITSPVDEFPGTVDLPKRLTLPQALEYENALSRYRALNVEEEDVSQTKVDTIAVDVICEVVEEWNLEDEDGEDLGQLSPDNFPATPRMASAELIAWLFDEIVQLYSPADPENVPNG